jgi:hypothetical protein
LTTTGDPSATPKGDATHDKGWPVKCSQAILLLGGIVAWLIAAALAGVERSLAVAVAFVPMGMLLIGAAAFFMRVRELGPKGVKMDPAVAVEALRAYRKQLPPPPEDASVIQERDRLMDGMESSFVALADKWGTAEELISTQIPTALTQSADVGVQRYNWGVQLEFVARRWLAAEGFALETIPPDLGVDFIGRRKDGFHAFAVRSSRLGTGGPTPEALRNGFLQARIWVTDHLGDDGPFFRHLVTDVVPPPNLLDRYRDQGVGVVHIDPDTGEVSRILSATNCR